MKSVVLATFVALIPLATSQLIFPSIAELEAARDQRERHLAGMKRPHPDSIPVWMQSLYQDSAFEIAESDHYDDEFRAKSQNRRHDGTYYTD